MGFMGFMERARLFLRIWFLFLCCSLYDVRAKQAPVTIEEAFETITENYNKKLRPNFDGPPVTIIASSYIVALDHINDVKSHFTVKMYFSQQWNDMRLAFGPKLGGAVNKPSMRITGDIVEDIWTPDTYVENEEGVGTHKVFSSVKITKNGTIHLSQRLSLKVNCPTMNLKLFPHDVQHCILLMTSYAYPNDDLIYEWRSHDAVKVGESSIASAFKLTKTQTNVKLQYFKASNATWTYLCLTFVLERKIAYYIIRIYLPAILVTFTSWISFWVDPKAIPARLSLCVITVLAMTTLSYSSQSMVPSVPYVKAVDCYLIISFFFVFGTLLEYAILLNSNLRCRISTKNEAKTEEISLNESKTADHADVEINGGSTNTTEHAVRPHDCKKKSFYSSWTIDGFSTVFFPSIYFLFHLIFFVVILS